jgi:hypothetical protein
MAIKTKVAPNLMIASLDDPLRSFFVLSGISKLAHLQPGGARSASKAFERAREIVRSAVLCLTYLDALIPGI